MTLDMFASMPHFADHMAPVWLALPPERRGTFYVFSRLLVAHLAKRGVAAVHEVPPPAGPILVASFGDQKHVRSLGRTRIARMEHGIGQSFVDSREGSYAGGVNADCVGLFLCPNEHSAERWRAAYPAAQVAVVGCPKLAGLPAREPGPGPVVAISFHWDGGNLRTKELIETHGAFGEYRTVLPALRRRFNVIGHGHPRVARILERRFIHQGIPFVADFTDVCRQADVYVCDTNSTLYEFASTGRPVVVVNSALYRRDVVHGLRFDWSTGTNVGVNVDRPEDLVAAVAEALEDAPARRAAREAALDLVYGHRDGSAASRAAAAVLAWAEERVEVAA